MILSKMNPPDLQELPVGFAVELGKQEALDEFWRLPKERQEAIINGSRHVHSKGEMQNYVENAFK